MARQLDPGAGFLPKKFVFSPTDQTITYEGSSWPLQFTETDDYVFCRTHDGVGEIIDLVSGLYEVVAKMEGSSDTPIGAEDADRLSAESAAVRFLAREKLSEYFYVDAKSIDIRMDDCGAPVAFANQQQLPVSLSFSHHGTVIAVSMGLIVN